MKIRKYIKNKYLMVLLAVALLLSMCIALSGCNKLQTIKSRLDQVSDLVTIKVNNYMAEWNNPAFNSTHAGDSGLTVHVPESIKLKITDLIVSPGSEAVVYADDKYSSVVSDITDIDINEVKELYIRVINSSNNAQRTDYKVTVYADVDNLSANKNVDNRDGHRLVSGDKTIIDGNEYIVITHYGQLTYLGDDANDLEENYILGCDIVREEGFPAPEFRRLDGVFDGNNYKFNIGMENYFVEENNGIVKNVILDDSDSEEKVASIPQKDTGYQLIKSNSNIIENCVNKNTIYRPNERYISAFARDYRLDVRETRLEKCINYGDVTASNAIGIGEAAVMNMCVNTGNILGAYSHIGVSAYANLVKNCSNLGDVIGGGYGSEEYIGEGYGAGICYGQQANPRSDIYTIQYNINYGEVRSANIVYGVTQKWLQEVKLIDNLNYGKIVGKEAYDITDSQ